MSVPPPGFIPPPDAPREPAPTPVAPASRRAAPRGLIAGGLLAAVVAVAAFLLFGNQSVDPIAQAATISSNASGYRMNMSFSIYSPQIGTPVTGSATAVVDPPDHAASMSLTLSTSQAGGVLGASTLRMAMVLEGQQLYLKFPPALVNRLPNLGGKPWIEQNVAKAGALPGLSSLGGDAETSDPTQVLRQLEVGADSVTNEGRQVVDGVQTTHYQAAVNLERLMPNVPSFILKQLTPEGQDIPVDVWIDSHSLVRRIVMSISLGATGQPSLQEDTTVDITGYGPQPRPTPPPADQVIDANSVPGLSS